MDPEPGFAGPAAYPIALLVDLLDRVVDDHVAQALAARGFGDLTRAQGAVFEMLDPGGSRVSDMARRARVTKQAMAQLVASVESLGYVERTADPDDRRAQLVRLTDRGEQAVAAARSGLDDLEAAWEAHLGRRRYACTRRALVELVEATGTDHLR